jgi:hypothetical protein
MAAGYLTVTPNSLKLIRQREAGGAIHAEKSIDRLPSELARLACIHTDAGARHRVELFAVLGRKIDIRTSSCNQKVRLIGI